MYSSGCRLARESLCTLTRRANSILVTTQFDELAWEFVAAALKEVPQMFQIWASKQGWDIEEMHFLQLKWDKMVSSHCPSCQCWKETSEHILLCREKGRVEFCHASIELLEQWLRDYGTDSIIHQGLVEYARGRGGISMSNIIWKIGEAGQYLLMAQAQDQIGLRHSMEGMISRELVICQDGYRSQSDTGWETGCSATGLVKKLLEVTHGQWLYRNLVVHEEHTGMLCTMQKVAIIQREIDRQIELGPDGLLEEDQYLAQ